MQLHVIAGVLRALAAPIVHLLEGPGRALTRWSDEADDVWEPFLDDAPPATPGRVAA